MSDQKRILIVEDSPTVIEMIQMMLRNMNCKVFSAGSEFGMFQNVEQFGKTVDLILMDISLKNENGLDLIEKLRLNPKYMDLPVIIVTEHATKDLILRARELSVKSYLRKPFDKTILIERISEIIPLEPLKQNAGPQNEASSTQTSAEEAPVEDPSDEKTAETLSEN